MKMSHSFSSHVQLYKMATFKNLELSATVHLDLIVCNYVSPNFFTPIPKFIVSYLARFLIVFSMCLALSPRERS